MRLMMSVSMLEFKRVLAPDARRQREETSDDRKTSSGPRKVTDWRKVAMISLGQTEMFSVCKKTWVKGILW